jgi:hypothetical protein
MTLNKAVTYVLAGLITFGSAACGTSDSGGTEPELPGSIAVHTETSGFQQDDSYQLLVDGVAAGTIGANDELMISELDPATYELALNDVADNCSVETSASATVEAGQTADVSLTVVCAPDEPTPYSIRANRDRPNLEDGTLTECSFGLCPTNEGWDMYVQFVSTNDPQAVIRQNTTTGVELAHVPGKTLATLTEADVDAATFSVDPIDESFDSNRVVLVKTDTGAVYALGNPVESTILLTFTFDAVLLSSGS